MITLQGFQPITEHTEDIELRPLDRGKEIFLTNKKDFIYLFTFRERGREGETEGEKH